MILQMDEVLWEFSKFYRKKFLAENPGLELSADLAAICHGARHGRDWSRRPKISVPMGTSPTRRPQSFSIAPGVNQGLS